MLLSRLVGGFCEEKLLAWKIDDRGQLDFYGSIFRLLAVLCCESILAAPLEEDGFLKAIDMR